MHFMKKFIFCIAVCTLGFLLTRQVLYLLSHASIMKSSKF
jgi:hypothetical protein